MRSFIVEWFSPDFHQSLYVPFLLVSLLLLIALAGSRSSVKARVLLPLLFTFFAALDAVRHIPIFILLAIPVIAAARPNSSTAPFHAPLPPHLRFRPLFNALALILLAVFACLRWASLARKQSAREARQFPQQAVAVLAAAHLPERLFVYYDWGGYAIWKLNPQYRVFADGRADLYGDEFLQQSIQTVVPLHQGWQEVLDDLEGPNHTRSPDYRPGASAHFWIPAGAPPTATPRQRFSCESRLERTSPITFR